MTRINNNIYLTLKELGTLAELVSVYDSNIGNRIRDNYNYLKFKLHYHELTTLCFNDVKKNPFCFKAPEQMELDFI